jgi:predicted Rossmann-fold nucleotide-binding protein
MGAGLRPPRIAVGGGWGTLSEVTFAMRIGRPVVLLEPDRGRDLPLRVAGSAGEAVRIALEAAAAGRRDA